MSTKTAFKRVALVAAAALAIGGVSAVSANATLANLLVNTGYTGAGTAAGTAIAGPANSIGIATSTGAGLAIGTAGDTQEYVTISGGTFAGGVTSATLGVNGGAILVQTPTVGTITISGYAQTGIGLFSNTVTDTVTINVIASSPGTVYSAAKVYGHAGVVTDPLTTAPQIVTATTDDAAFTTAGVTAAAGSPSVANFQVVENDANGVALTTGFVPVTVTVTNGLLQASGFVGTIGVAASTYLAGTPAGIVDFTLSSLPGVSGVSTVTIAVNGVTVRTFAATFTGAAVKIVATAINPVIGVAGVTGVTANTNAIKVQEFDANGNAVAVPSISLTSANTAVLGSVVLTAPGTAPVANSGTFADSSTISGTAVGVTLTGAAVGSTTFTVSDGTLTSAPVTVRVSSAVPTSVVLSTDAAAYASGGAGTLTTTLSDAAGTVPAGTYVVFTGQATSSYALTVGSASLPGAGPVAPAVTPVLGSVTVNDAGVYTDSFNAPISDATGVTISATAAATTITVTPATFDVTSGASDAANAATDAANEATDAANAATDAANAAADSADAATQAAQDAGDKADAALAAVTALSQQVTTLLAKVASLAATLAKITKAIAALPKK